ncbi:TetR/AcrR family transcriptional regulator [Actinomadura madurae]|uniref:TetR/AcrR family transcriptional regulator n=1 Tax=Actinomadura madurae TaxID=1993 RepID=UPI0020269B34|nr:TetR/AcrR family transcriptional regulator [Actinomadura madurae]MCP9950378.1 TetR family transcriptional regulator [Actinomadura madurae]MCP9967160.1 TetR family transcriptional regulator [Actinomadura madurae]MCP9979623.1 TetR family transcriptional regulator [Actinomadura madurae]MCQ0008847.1 TetR family transcriptional regulator [Actinomadura madurae]MCQ0015836.1 TetR family transcriptional regulator [Actinomadura madurae]
MTSSDTGRERILEVATRLFAALGYDGTSTRMIAEAAGLNVATIAYHVGGKRDLYLAVMERAHVAERAALDRALAEITMDREGLLALVDGYVDFCIERPEVPALWMHRWLSDAADIAHLEEQYVRPLVEIVTGLARKIVADDVDVDFVVWTIVWCTHGFGCGGLLDADGNRLGLDDPAAVARFRAQMRRTVAAAIGLPSGNAG